MGGGGTRAARGAVPLFLSPLDEREGAVVTATAQEEQAVPILRSAPSTLPELIENKDPAQKLTSCGLV